VATKAYVRIKYRGAGQRARWYWAIKLKPGMYKQVLPDGNQCIHEVVREDGVSVCREHLMIGEPIAERPARMNLRYAELEEVKMPGRRR
jgi:hypothetical protein